MVARFFPVFAEFSVNFYSFDRPSVFRWLPLRLEFKASISRDNDMLPQCSFLPHICHKPKWVEKDNGGFLRVREGQYFVAKTAQKGRFLS
jgi:hypothetical protein